MLLNNRQDIQLFTRELNTFLKTQYLAKTDPAYCNLSTITARRAKYDIYLRLYGVGPCWPPKTLVIARMIFTNQRKGEGKRFLSFLVQMARLIEIEHIGIEQTNEASASFALKYGFTKCTYENNYVVSIANLEQNLQSVSSL